jgi:hypothetical protein
MKNIHVLPTDKPSRLHITSKLDLYPNGVSRKPQGLCKNQHIYITTDEEIKEGDWFLEKAGRQYPIQWNGVDKLNRHCKKIILTTDPSLDGVQAIDDEFLEWFVKNPSREYVNFTSHGNEKGTKDYELIIPKAEPKEETLEEVDYEKLKQLLIEFRKVPITFVPDERMYSEEDLREAFRQGKENMDYSDTYGWTSKLTEQEWFEQFKKK